MLRRQPRTVNHRLCVLASFFDFLAGRDRDRGVGVRAARPSPVPRERSPMDGSHGIPGLGKPGDPAWVMLRRGHGRPLSYPAFECALRHLCGKVGVRVTAHMFRHAMAQALVDTSGLKVAQEILGHAHVSTTADTYARVDEHAMVSAMERVRDLFDLSARDARSAAPGASLGASDRYVFPYDPATLAELDGIAGEVGA